MNYPPKSHVRKHDDVVYVCVNLVLIYITHTLITCFHKTTITKRFKCSIYSYLYPGMKDQTGVFKK